MQKIRIDFDNPGLPQHISAVENDSQSRFFQATLYENGKAYTAPAGASYSIMYRGFGPQNQGWYDTINDGAGKRAACAVSGNVVTCEIARQVLQVPGHVSIVLCVTTGKGYMLKSWPIECDCKNDRYDSTVEIQSFFYITQVSNADWNRAIQALEELKNTIDPTLSLSGKAADAAKVGEVVGQVKEKISDVVDGLNSGFVKIDEYVLAGVLSGEIVESETQLLSPVFYMRNHLGATFESLGDFDIRLIVSKTMDAQSGLTSYGWSKQVKIANSSDLLLGFYYGRIAINTKASNASAEQAQKRIENEFICSDAYFNRMIGKKDINQIEEKISDVVDGLNSGFVKIDEYVLAGVLSGEIVESETQLLSPVFYMRNHLGATFESLGDFDIRLIVSKTMDAQSGLTSYGWSKQVKIANSSDLLLGFYYGRIAINTKASNASAEQAQKRIENEFICSDAYFNRMIGKKDINQIEEKISNLKLGENSRGKAVEFELLPVNSNGTYRFNSASFVQDNTIIYNGNQYVIVVDTKKNPIILKRDYPNGKWDMYDLSAVVGNPLNAPTADDQHNTYSLGIDKNGYIHVAGNMHANPLRYIISKNPEDISSWEAGTMVGTQENSVTYPVFVLMPNKNLLFFYRNGGSGNGNTYVNLYNADNQKWQRQSLIFDGTVSNENAYLNRVAVDYNTGYIHLMYCWRQTSGSNTNNDICYCLSKDEGKTWGKTDGTLYDSPIKHSTAEIVVDTEDSGSGLLNQNGLDVDANGNPHGCFMMYDKNGYTQYYHIWYDGTEWHNDQITDWDSRLEFSGGYTQGEICRPSIAVSKSNRIFVIYRNSNLSQNTLRMMEILQDRVIDFDVVKLDLQNYEYTFDYKTLKNNDKLISIVSNAIAGDWITNASKKEWWTTQYTALLTIDLTQIDYLISGVYQLPTMQTRNILSLFDYTSDSKDFVKIPNLSFVAKKTSQLFIKLNLYAKSASTFVIGYKKDNKVIQIMSISKSDEYKFYFTPWILMPNIDVDKIIDIFGKGNCDIKTGSVEFGVIDNI